MRRGIGFLSGSSSVSMTYISSVLKKKKAASSELHFVTKVTVDAVTVQVGFGAKALL